MFYWTYAQAVHTCYISLWILNQGMNWSSPGRGDFTAYKHENLTLNWYLESLINKIIILHVHMWLANMSVYHLMMKYCVYGTASNRWVIKSCNPIAALISQFYKYMNVLHLIMHVWHNSPLLSHHCYWTLKQTSVRTLLYGHNIHHICYWFIFGDVATP